MSLNEVKMSNVTCNRVGHQDKFIEILCLAPECKESATLCSKCLVNTHLECRKSVQDQEAIQKQLMGLKQFSLDIVVLQERVNKQFKELIGLIEQILSPISKYQDQPNLTNLNEIAFLLKKSPMEIINQSLESTKIQIKLLLDNHNLKQENKQVQEKKIIQEQAPSKDAISWYSKGEALYDQKKYSEAIDCYDKAIAIDPNYEISWYSKGEALYYQKKYSEAIDCYDKAIAINPNYHLNWYSKGEALYDQKKYSEAIDCYDKAIAINPNYHLNWYSKGKALYDQKKYSEAIDCYDKAIAVDPNYHLSWYCKGKALYYQKKYSDAIDCYNKAIAVDPNYHLIWYSKGEALVEFGKLTDAIQCLEKAFQIRPNEKYIRDKLEEAKQKLRMKK